MAALRVEGGGRQPIHAASVLTLCVSRAGKRGPCSTLVLSVCASVATSGLPEHVSSLVRDGLEQGLAVGAAHEDRTGAWTGAPCDQSLCVQGHA